MIKKNQIWNHCLICKYGIDKYLYLIEVQWKVSENCLFILTKQEPQSQKKFFNASVLELRTKLLLLLKSQFPENSSVTPVWNVYFARLYKKNIQMYISKHRSMLKNKYWSEPRRRRKNEQNDTKSRIPIPPE